MDDLVPGRFVVCVDHLLDHPTSDPWKVIDTAFAIVDELEAEWAAQMGEERFQQLRAGLGELFEIVERSEAEDRGRHSRR